MNDKVSMTHEINNPGQHAWFRQKGESRKAYQAFRIYRDMGEVGTYAKVAEQLGKNISLIGKWGGKWMWVDRRDAYLTNLEFELMAEERKDRIAMKRNDAKIARMFKQKVVDRLKELKPGELSPTQVAQWFEVATKVERLSLGEATGIIGKQVTEARDDLSRAVESDPELAEEFAKILQQTRPSTD